MVNTKREGGDDSPPPTFLVYGTVVNGNSNVRPTCKMCDKLVMSSGCQKSGLRKWKTICASCRIKQRKGYLGAMSFKNHTCDNCDFIAVHSCQLDIDHIDGNNRNNNKDNLQILCANCHRLKTYQNEDWKIPTGVENNK